MKPKRDDLSTALEELRNRTIVMESREYARRHAGCDAISKKVSGKHAAVQLSAMQMEYELEASALLALRHAADAYRKTRPELT